MLNILEFPHLGEHKMTKGKTKDLPVVSATPVNTLVDEEDENPDVVKEDN